MLNSIINKALNDKKIRIVFLGDSLTASYFESFENIHGTCEPENGFPEKLTRLLRTTFPDTEFAVKNSGVGGECVTDAMRRLDRDVFDFAPDLVIINFMLNDARLLSDEEYYYALKKLLGMIKGRGIECVFMTEPMGCTKVTSPVRPDIGAEMARCQTNGKVDRFCGLAKKAAEETETALCDVYSMWKHFSDVGIDTDRLLTNRINHPMREMHTVFAAELFRTILF